MTFRKLAHCRVEFKDSSADDLADALVTSNGDTFSLHVYDQTGRAEKVDRLTDCTVDERTDKKGTTYIVAGRSTQLRSVVGVPEADQTVTIHVVPGAGCTNCG